jgi:hypothetical protein
MSKIIFKLLTVILIGTIGGTYYVWQEAIKVPSEYTKSGTADRVDSQSLPMQPQQITERAAVTKQKLTAPIDLVQIGQKVTIKLSERDLHNLVIEKLASLRSNRQLAAEISGVKTSINDGEIHAGALVNLEQVTHSGKFGQLATLSKLTDKLTFLKNQNIYIGIVGKPVVIGSQIKFASDTKIKVGNLNFTISQIAETLGISTDKIQKAIDLHLQQPNFQVDRINLNRNELEIEGKKKRSRIDISIRPSFELKICKHHNRRSENF